MRRILSAALVLLLLAIPAYAATRKPSVIISGIVQGIPATDTLILPTAGTGNASINLPHGTDPTSPNNGDCWTTTAGLKCRINGGTITYGSGGGTPGGSSGQIQWNNAGGFDGLTFSGDCTVVTSTGVITCLKLNGVSPGYFFSGTDAANLTGTLGVAHGGTGDTSLTAHGVLLGQTTGAIVATAAPTDGQLLIGKSSNDPVLATLTAGTGINITNGAGAITITNVGAGSVGAEVLISEVETTGSQASVTFSSFASFRHYHVIVDARSTTSAANTTLSMQLNADTGSNYDSVGTQTQGSSTTTTTTNFAQTAAILPNIAAATGPASDSSSVDIWLYNASGTTFHKSGTWTGGVKTVDAAGNVFGNQGHWWWKATPAAITTITIFPTAGNFVDHSVVSLYGHY